MGYRYDSGLLGDDHYNGIGLFGNAHCGSVASAYLPLRGPFLRQGQKAPGSQDTVPADDGGLVVEWVIGEEDGEQKLHHKLRVQGHACSGNLLQIVLLFQYYKRTMAPFGKDSAGLGDANDDGGGWSRARGAGDEATGPAQSFQGSAQLWLEDDWNSHQKRGQGITGQPVEGGQLEQIHADPFDQCGLGQTGDVDPVPVLLLVLAGDNAELLVGEDQTPVGVHPVLVEIDQNGGGDLFGHAGRFKMLDQVRRQQGQRVGLCGLCHAVIPGGTGRPPQPRTPVNSP